MTGTDPLRRAAELGLELAITDEPKPRCRPFVDRYRMGAHGVYHQALCHVCGWEGTDRTDAATAERERDEHGRTTR